MKRDSAPVRAYRQTARAKAAAETGERIVDAFTARMQTGWFDEIRLEDVAADAEVSVQTVIRRFGGKEGLLDACHARMAREIEDNRDRMPAGDVAGALDTIINEYELRGDFVMRLLAQEERYPQIRALTDHGRAVHRRWTGDVFAPWLARLSGAARREAHDRLVIALDIYVWKLVRRDMQRGRAVLRRMMLALCAAALDTEPELLETSHGPEKRDA